MSINWVEVKKAFFPIKDYEDFQKRWQASLSFPFVKEKYNYTMPQLTEFTRLCLGGDPRGRYNNYADKLILIIDELHQAGIRDILKLWSRVETRQKFGSFSEECGIEAAAIATLLKYLSYWFIPAEKYLSGLIRPDKHLEAAVQALRTAGIRTNMELLQQGLSAAGRKTLAKKSSLPEAVILDLTNRADFSRMPWASKATISNIIEAGYSSLAALTNADPEKLYKDFFDYGKAIGKNLKLGNEIESSHRVAKIIPPILK